MSCHLVAEVMVPWHFARLAGLGPLWPTFLAPHVAHRHNPTAYFFTSHITWLFPPPTHSQGFPVPAEEQDTVGPAHPSMCPRQARFNGRQTEVGRRRAPLAHAHSRVGSMCCGSGYRCFCCHFETCLSLEGDPRQCHLHCGVLT